MWIPLNPLARWPQVRPLAASLALALACTLPLDRTAASHTIVREPDAVAIAGIHPPSSIRAPLSPSDAIVVTSCDDSGPGSLREAFANVVGNQIIDLSELTCSTITLTTGALQDTVNAAQVQLIGSGQTIDGNGSDRVIVHVGADTLGVVGLTITNGFASSFGGGCIYSVSAVSLDRSTVSSCHVTSAGNDTAYGGAIFANAFVALYSGSVVTSSSVGSAAGPVAGGGIWAHDMRMDGSTVSHNFAYGNSSNYSRGGGIFSSRASGGSTYLVSMYQSTISENRSDEGGGAFAANVAIDDSTFLYNTADSSGGGLFVPGTDGGHSIILQSTISGNHSGYLGGGIVIGYGNTADIIRCTITDNASYESGGGVYLNGTSERLISTIIAGNSSTTVAPTADVGGGPTQISRANNLIVVSALAVPADTLVAPPLLGPMQDNGGPTQTRELLPGSPAIDHGSNTDQPSGGDQRGTGFARVIGVAADIGAVEFDDVIFSDGFERRS